MKVLVFSLLFSVAALAQTPNNPKILTFNRADSEHCKVIVVDGKPMLQSTFNGTTVAVAMPDNHGPLGFSVWVSISQQEKGKAQVVPNKFSAVYSDSAKTRFPYFDMEHEGHSTLPITESTFQRGRKLAGTPPPLGSLNSTVPDGQQDGKPAGGPSRWALENDPNASYTYYDPYKEDSARREVSPRNLSPAASLQSSTAKPQFLHRTTLKQGSAAAGFIYFGQPKGSTIRVGPTDMLDEIDIPVNGVIFRF